MSRPPGRYPRWLASHLADRFLRQLITGTARAARFAEPSAAERQQAGAWDDPATVAARRRSAPSPRSRFRSARAQALAAALLVIGCLAAGLGRLSWLVLNRR